MLRHGQSVTVKGLPYGTVYTVAEREANQDGYATVATGETGTVVAGETATAAFENIRESGESVPMTGDHSRVELFIVLAALALACAVFSARRATV